MYNFDNYNNVNENIFNTTLLEKETKKGQTRKIERKEKKKIKEISCERNFSNCVEKPERLRTSTAFEPMNLRFRCDAQTN